MSSAEKLFALGVVKSVLGGKENDQAVDDREAFLWPDDW